MGSYSALKEAVATHSPKNAKNPVVTFGLGSVAGIITVYATQPFDTIKTRAQGAKGATMVEAVKAIISDGGVRGFWSGSTMRLGRLVLSGGIVFTVYENVVTLLSGIKK
jgi:solute carrier family 25 (mitochondrial citrate transporter), member 1